MQLDTKYLKQRGGSNGKWYFQRRLPSYMRQYYLNKKELVIPLGTDSLQVAQAERVKILEKFDRIKAVAKGYEADTPLIANIKRELSRLTESELRGELEKEGDKLHDAFPWAGYYGADRDYKKQPDPTDKEVLRYNVLAELTGSKPYSSIPDSYNMSLTYASKKVKEIKNHLPRKTLIKYDRALELFNGYMNRKDFPAHQIKFQLVSEFILTLREKPYEYSDRYIKDLLSYLNTLWQYVRKSEGLRTVSPFDLKDHEFQRDTERSWVDKLGYYKAWEEEEILRVMNIAVRNAGQSKHKLPELDILPIFIGWYTGARIDEIYSLTADDIKDIDGIPCFEFKHIDNLNEDRKEKFHKKNAYARRKVPIHNDLKPILDRFFYKNYKFPRTSTDAYGSWFGKAKTQAGYFEKFKAFHSLRTNVITSLVNKQVYPVIANAITGHSSKNLGIGISVYAEQLKPPIINPEIQKLPSFPCEFPTF